MNYILTTSLTKFCMLAWYYMTLVDELPRWASLVITLGFVNWGPQFWTADCTKKWGHTMSKYAPVDFLTRT